MSDKQVTASKPSPVLSQDNFSNGALQVYWQPLTDYDSFYTSVFLGENQVDGANKTTKMAFSAMIKPNPPLDASKSYTVKTAQCDSTGVLTSAFSLPLNVLQNPVVNLKAVYTGQLVTVSWTLPATGNPSGAQVYLYEGTEEMCSKTAAGTSTQLIPPTPLSSSKQYTIYAAPYSDSGGSTGPSTSITLVLSRPEVASVEYSIVNNMVTAYAAPPYPTGVYLRVFLYADGVLIGQADGVNAMSAQVALTASTLDYSRLYTVTLCHTTKTAQGPESAAKAVVICPPQILSAAFSGTQVETTWFNYPTRLIPTGGQIALLGDGNPLDSVTVQGNAGRMNVPQPPTCQKYELQAAAIYGNSTGPASTKVVLPSTQPVISAVAVAGGKVSVAWAAVTGAPGYRVSILDSGGKAVAMLDTSATSATLDAALLDSTGYSAVVQAYGSSGNVLLGGPLSAAVKVIPVMPQLVSAACNAANVTVGWTAVANATALGITGYRLGLFSTDTLAPLGNAVAVNDPAASSGVIAKPEAGQRVVAMVWAVGDKSTGGRSLPLELLTNAPIPLAVESRGTTLLLSWQPLPGLEPEAAAYKVVYTSGGTAMSTITTACFASLPAGSTAMTVQTVNGKVGGPAASFPAALTAQPVISAVAVAAGKVSVAWAAVTGAPGYRVSILDSGGKAVAMLDTSATSATLDAALLDSTGYSAVVQAYGSSGNVLLGGPLSAAVKVIPVMPQLVSAACDAANVTVGWTAVANAAALGITGYRLGLFSTDTLAPLGNAVAVNDPAASSGVIAKPEAGQRVVAMVWAVGDKSTGGRSLPLELLTNAPIPLAVESRGTTLLLSWQPLPGLEPEAAAYKVGYTSGGTAMSTITTACFASLPAGSTAMTVQTVNGKVGGPAASFPAALTAQPVISTVAVAGGKVSVAWAAVTGAPGYRVSILDSGGKAVAMLDTSATSATLDVALLDSTGYSAVVQAYGTSGNVLLGGPLSAAVKVIPVMPQLVSAACDTANVTVGWTAVANAATLGITGYRLGLFSTDTLAPLGNAVAVNDPAASSGVIAKPEAGQRVVAMVWAVGDKSTGGRSLPLELLTNAPIPLAVESRGTTLLLSWQPLPGLEPEAAAYKVVYTSGGTAMSTITTACFASLPAGSTAMTVQTVNGRVGGPAASFPAALTTQPVISSVAVAVAGGKVSVAWAAVTGAPGYRVSILDSGGKAVAMLDTNATSAVLDVAMLDSTGYSAVVQTYGTSGNVLLSGPLSAAVKVIPIVPRLASAACDTANVTVGWAAIANAAALGITGYRLGLFSTDTLAPLGNAVAIDNPTASSGVITKPAAGQRAVAMVWTVGDKTTGGRSLPLELLTNAPIPLAVESRGTTLLLSWQSLLGLEIDAAAYKVGYTSGGTVRSAITTACFAFVPSDSSAITVQTVNDAVSGPPASFPAPLTAQPVVSAVAVAGGKVSVSWAAVTGAPGYRVSILDSGGAAVARLDTSATSAVLDVALLDSAGYGAAVQTYGTSGNVLLGGPLSTAVKIIPVVPRLGSAACDAANVTVGWTAVANAAALGITGYRLGLFSTDTLAPLGNPTAIDDPAATSGVIAKPDAGQRVVAMVWAVGDKTSGARSLPLELLTNAPIPLAVENRGNTLLLSWQPLPGLEPEAAAYKVGYTSGGTARSAITTACFASLPNDASAIVVQTVNGASSGPPASFPAPLTALSTISAVAAADGKVGVAWATVPGAPGYRVSILDTGGKAVATLETNTPSAMLDVALLDSTGYSAVVQTYGISGNVLLSGPLSTAVKVIPVVPQLVSAACDTTNITVGWTAVANAATLGITGYRLGLFDADTLAAIGNPTAINDPTAASGIIAKPAAGQRAVAMVWAVGDKTSGACSPALDLITAAPEIHHADISASTVTVAWEPIPWPAVDTYKVTFYAAGGSPSSDVACSGTTLVCPNNLAADQVMVKVAAVTGTVSGPSSPGKNLYGDSGNWFPRPVGTSDSTPYLSRSTSLSAAPSTITLAVPDIFSSTSVTLPIQQGAFTLSRSENAVFPYTITIPADSVAWKFDAASRETLFSDFTNFLKALEKQNNQIILREGALYLVRQSLALALPLLYEETLTYACGFDPDAAQGGYVDLLPGMHLHLEQQSYQFTSPTGVQNGYTGAGSGGGLIHAYNSGDSQVRIGFDAFLSTMQRPVVPAAPQGGGGIIDLYVSSGRRLYYRLFLPKNLMSSTDVNAQSTANCAVLVGADTFTDVLTATADYEAHANFNQSPGVFPFFFRGRTIPIPHITVLVNGAPLLLPLGATVKNLLQSRNPLPDCRTTPVDGFTLKRPLGNLVDTASISSLSTAAVRTGRIRLECVSTTFQPGKPDFFDLPLQQGDIVTIAAQ